MAWGFVGYVLHLYSDAFVTPPLIEYVFFVAIHKAAAAATSDDESLPNTFYAHGKYYSEK